MTLVVAMEVHRKQGDFVEGSKPDDQEAVTLCGGHAVLRAAVMRHCYTLVDADTTLADSVDSVTAPLHRLLHLQADPLGLAL